VAFEAHAQNILVRFDKSTGEPLGLVIRDLGGLRIHPETLCHSTGIDFKFLPGHCVATSTLQETYPKLYHTMVHNHLQRLIRVLRLHYDGSGWEILRRHMEAVIPADHELRDIWLNSARKEVPSKCLLRMRMRDSYRDVSQSPFYRSYLRFDTVKISQMVYSPYPNMIQYRPRSVTAVR
jgi:siderophore synthetase component